MHLDSIRLHPVKSTAIRSVASAEVGRAGLRGDREWMVVDADGEMISARELPALFRITASTPQTDDTTTDLVLRAAGAEPLEVARPTDGERPVRLFRKTRLVGRPVAPHVDAWLRDVLGRDDVSLVHCHDPAARPVGKPGDQAAFQDKYPVTLLTLASVAQIDAWAAQDAAERGEAPPPPLPASRFRPSLVVAGDLEPFAEDTWPAVRIGDVTFRHAERVARCVMTTLDPADLSRGKEPLRTLARHRRADGKTWCAVHLIPENEGVLRVGDAVVPGEPLGPAEQ